MAVAGITYEMAAPDLATVVANGVCFDEPRVLPATNQAIKFLLDLGIWVGTMATYDIVADGTELFLPKQLENAIDVEVLNDATVRNQRDVTRGAYDCVSNFTYVDPATAHDNPLVDLFLWADPDDPSILRRKYDYPGLQPNATVRVTGSKRYVPITDPGHALIIQNVLAIKFGILALEFLMRGPEAAAQAEGYKQMAVAQLTAEVKKHQLDPRRILKLKSDYQGDISTYAEGTLGRTRARLALELPGFLLRGKSEITYLVNRAVQMLVDNRNQLAIAGRISVHGGITELSYVPVNIATTVLAWPDYNQIRLMVQSFITEGADPQALGVAEEYQKKAFELQRAQLIETTEKARHTTYTSALTEFVSGTFGWTVARLALEMPGGLAMTTAEIERLLGRAEQRLLERGIWKNCLRTLSATITGGEVLFPRDVETVLSANICGMPTDVRSIFFQFQKNGPGGSIGCGGLGYIGCSERFDDCGEVYFPQTGSKRRKFRYLGSCSSSVELTAVCKIRYETKSSCDEMVIKNQEALGLMCQSIMCEKKEDWNGAAAAKQMALDVLEFELREFLGGIQHVPNVDETTFGFGGLGVPL